ncbi:MAG: hypothetical protein CM1200mP30_22030 [Pseudomonadota bacterium]|nr:MAG: hypothetical protein CM1200mP30_22030 [Pseudomonadota bacterium]
MLEAGQAKIFASEMAIKVTNDALQIFGSSDIPKLPLERKARDARMFTIGGNCTDFKNVVASALLERKLPQTREGILNKGKH